MAVANLKEHTGHRAPVEPATDQQAAGEPVVQRRQLLVDPPEEERLQGPVAGDVGHNESHDNEEHQRPEQPLT
jgi:hypothetical protein